MKNPTRALAAILGFLSALLPSLTHAQSSGLDLGSMVQPVPLTAKFTLPDYHVWCGSCVKGPDGKYHLFYSRWPKNNPDGFAPGWAIVSEVAYAVADDPGGPFTHVNVCLPPRGTNPSTSQKYWDADMTHNPYCIRKDGIYYLYYIGNSGDGTYAVHRNNDRIGVAWSANPAGPWTRLDQPVIDITPDPAGTSAAFDSLCVSNPAITEMPDGRILVIYKGVKNSGSLMGGPVRHGAAIADTPLGTYQKQASVAGQIFLASGTSNMDAEDPFIWYSTRYGNRYYAVTRDVVGTFTGASGGLALFESPDGLNWSPSAHPKVLGAGFTWANGSVSSTRVERPFLLMDETGLPVKLFGATNGYQSSVSYNIQIPLLSPPTLRIESPAASAVTIANPQTRLHLAAAASSTTQPDTFTVSWTQVSGAAPAVFENAASATTSVSFPQDGLYVLRCTATDTAGSASDDVTVAINSPLTVSLSQGANEYAHTATMIRGDNPTWNSGARDQMLIGRWQQKGMRALLSFPLDSIPADATLQSVSLDLWTAGVSATTPVGPLQLKLLDGTPTEGTGNGLSSTAATSGATWNHRTAQPDPGITWNTPGGDAPGAVIAEVPGYTDSASNLPLTFASSPALVAAAQSALATAAPLDLILSSPLTEQSTTDSITRIASDDHENSTIRPRLNLTFSGNYAPSAAPGPAPAALTGSPAPLAAALSHADSCQWQLLSGPGTATFADASSPSTTVTFDQPGTYILRLSATSASGQTSQDLTVTVNASPPAIGPVLVNQSGYNTAESKRFTAPLATDGTPFSIVTDPGGTTVFTGTVTSGVGDFTALQPAETGNFRVLLGTAPDPPASHVFGIGPFWMERVSYRRMVQFFIDSRSGFGDATTWDVTTGKYSSGIAWRDSHQFSFELRTLIQWYAANPDAFGTDRMPVEGTYKGLRHTLPADAPEIVRLIHWGADIYLRGALNHTLIKEELAYFVYYYPLLQQWIPVSLYNEARDFLFANWSNTARDRWNWYDITHTGNLFQTYTVMGGTKGSFPPGHSIVPNLLMHQVALREGRSDAAAFLTAARSQVQWIVNNKSATDPLMTKGQRMSEHILVPALAEFLMRDPQTTVTGVDAWLATWADTAIARSNNYWDFRKYSETIWTPENVPGSHPWWNEPGNIAGFPASALAAITRLTDPAKADRLRQIAVSQIDQVFGRNPYNRHFCFRGAQANYGFEGVETGWFSQHIGGLGVLENVRGVLDASVKHLAFPYNPNEPPGYVEGWVAFNSAWNSAMVWSARDRSSIRFPDADPQATVGQDGNVRIELTAPLNFSRSLAESARVRITSGSGDQETVTLTETGPDTSIFRGSIILENTTPSASGDESLEAAPGHTLTASYAHDVFTRSATATAAAVPDLPLAITTDTLPPARVGQTYAPVTLRSVYGEGTHTWEIISGSLPAGMELLSNGIIQGSPTASGTFTPTIRVTAGADIAEKILTLSCSALQITTSSLPDAFGGYPYSLTLATSGAIGTVIWSSPSTLPSGLTLSPSGVLSGTPTDSGTSTLSLIATDSSGTTISATRTLRVVSLAGVVFNDTFASSTGSWFKAAPASGDSLSVNNGELEWKEAGSVVQETIARSFPSTTLTIGQTLRLSFDYRQNGTTPNNIIRAGFYKLTHPVTAHNWAGANAVGSWKGYGTFVRDDDNTGNVARVESGTSTSTTVGPNCGSSGAYTNITSPANTTRFNLSDNGTVTYQCVFDVTYVSATRMDTRLTVSSTTNGSTNTHFSIPGTTSTIHKTLDAVVLKQAGHSAMPAYYDNVKVELLGGLSLDPGNFSDWQRLTWPATTDPETTGPNQDPDHDGWNNLLEWALLLDPTRPDSFRPVFYQDGGYLLYTYSRRKTAPGQAAFQVEWSDTLAEDWSSAEVVTAPANSIDASTESVTASIPAGPSNQRFIRLRITTP